MFVWLVLLALAGGNYPSVLAACLLTALCYLETTRQKTDTQTTERHTDKRQTYRQQTQTVGKNKTADWSKQEIAKKRAHCRIRFTWYCLFSSIIYMFVYESCSEFLYLYLYLLLFFIIWCQIFQTGKKSVRGAISRLWTQQKRLNFLYQPAFSELLSRSCPLWNSTFPKYFLISNQLPFYQGKGVKIHIPIICSPPIIPSPE